MTVQEKIAEIEAREKAASPGPWGNSPLRVDSYWVYDKNGMGIAYTYGFPSDKSNLKLITHAREDVPFLLAELKKCREALGAIEALRWTEVTDGSGPSDATPTEKGLYMFAGRTHDIARKALGI